MLSKIIILVSSLTTPTQDVSTTESFEMHKHLNDSLSTLQATKGGDVAFKGQSSKLLMKKAGRSRSIKI